MSDQERARALVFALVERWDVAEDVHAEDLAFVTAELAAVRLEERRAITTYLREASFVAAADVLVALADRIECGEASS